MIAAAVVALFFAPSTEARFPEPPLGLDIFMPIPEENPLTPERVAIGRRLFFDRRLSADGSLSCATCHDPARAFSDGRPVASGLHRARGTRNSPAIINRGYGSVFFWDGRANTLEQQVMEPILDPKELGLVSAKNLETRVRMPAKTVAAALATYVRTIRAGGSRFDRYLAGEVNALTPQEKFGLTIFRGKGGCVGCHVGPLLSDEQFHNTGIAWRNGAYHDAGRMTVSGRLEDLGAFKTPTLREIQRTAPYMHDGSLATLEDVVDFYSRGGPPDVRLDPLILRVNLTSKEKRALVAFLQSLTGEIREGWR
jgi:cytochrome c peroxidase